MEIKILVNKSLYFNENLNLKLYNYKSIIINNSKKFKLKSFK